MRVALLGGTGFIGTALGSCLGSLGHEVICYSRSEPTYKCRHIKWSLGDHPHVVSDCDTLLHLAWDRSNQQNCRESAIWTRESIVRFQQRGVTKQWFMSSYSAAQESKSAYGKSKWVAETYARELGVGVIRPGLVIGDGGIYSSVRRLANLSPVIVIPRLETKRIPIISLATLTATVSEILAEDSGFREPVVLQDDFVTLKDLMRGGRAVDKKPLRVVEVPIWTIALGLNIAALARIPLGISSDSLKSLSAPQYSRTKVHR